MLRNFCNALVTILSCKHASVFYELYGLRHNRHFVYEPQGLDELERLMTPLDTTFISSTLASFCLLCCLLKVCSFTASSSPISSSYSTTHVLYVEFICITWKTAHVIT